jgi:tetratricopeptide (TPR) repeat protein
MKFLTLLLLLISTHTMAETDFEKAEKLYNQAKYSEAKVLFESYLKKNPNSYKSVEYLGDIAGHSKKWDEAIKYYKYLKVQFPNTANYWYKYGGALGMKSKSISKWKALTMVDEVEKAFLTAAKLDKKHVDSRWALVILYTELPGIVGGSQTKAKKYAQEIMVISAIDGYLAKGYIEEYYHRNTNAEQNYLKAHELGNSKTTFQKLYDLYWNKLKDKEKAKNLKEKFES